MWNKLLIELGEHLKKNLREEKSKEFMAKYSVLLEQRDTSDVWRQFAIWILVDPEHGVIRFTNPGSEAHIVIRKVAQLYIENCEDEEVLYAANSAAAAAVANYTNANPYKSAATVAWGVATFAWSSKANIYYYSAAYYNDYCPTSAVIDAARCHSYFAADASAGCAHYQRMADKLIELLQAAPQKIMVGTIDDASMYNAADPAGSTVLCTIYVPEPPVINENLINKQERIIDDMDHSKEISFSISHHNGTKHIMRGKETIEGAVNRIECALSIVKSVLKDDNTSECTNIDLNITSGRIIIT